MKKLRGAWAAVAALVVCVSAAGFLIGCDPLGDFEEPDWWMTVTPSHVTLVEGRWREVEVRSNISLDVWDLGWMNSHDYAVALPDSMRMNGSVAIVRIRAVGPGSTTIPFGVLAVDDEASTELSVTVRPVSIETFSIGPDTSTIAVEQTCTIIPHAIDSSGWELVGQPIEWDVADTSVAALLLVWDWYYTTEPPSSALFQGRKAGETTVTATVEGFTATAVIRVVEP